MWNAFRKLLKKSAGHRPPLAARRFGVEPLEDRLNLSVVAAYVAEPDSGGRNHLFASTPLASAHSKMFDEGDVTSRGAERTHPSYDRPEPYRAPAALVNGPMDRALAADPLRSKPLSDLGSSSLDWGLAIRLPAARPVLEAGRQTRPSFEARMTLTIPADYVERPRIMSGTPVLIFWFPDSGSVNSPTAPVRGEAHVRVPPPEHKVQTGSIRDAVWSNLSAATGDDVAEASFTIPAATTGQAASTAAYSSFDPRGKVASYSDEGGLIDIGGSGNQDISPAKTSIPGESRRAGEDASGESRLDQALLSLAEAETNRASENEEPRGPASPGSALHEPLPRLLAESAEGGMIDLAEISSLKPELLAESRPLVARTDDGSNSRRRWTETIQVDSSVGLFRAFELAIAPEGEMYEPTDGSAVTLPDEDTSTETPVSTPDSRGVIEVDPAVSGAAAAIPAVLMVANWAQATRRKRRGNEATAT